MTATMWLLLGACTSSGTDSADSAVDTAGDTADSASNEPGVLGLAFELKTALVEDMEEPPVGSFRGSIFAEDQANAGGPIEGAVSLVDLEVALDFTTGENPTAVLWTSDPLPSQKLWVLGCLDSDGNDCEKKDPITIPNSNKFLLAAGGETDATVKLEMLRP